MTIQAQIEQKIRQAMQPDFLEVLNESHMHNVPPGSESHFKVTVVSAQFNGKMLIARHRQINGILAEELNGKIHALALHTLTPEEHFAKGGRWRNRRCVWGVARAKRNPSRPPLIRGGACHNSELHAGKIIGILVIMASIATEC